MAAKKKIRNCDKCGKEITKWNMRYLINKILYLCVPCDRELWEIEMELTKEAIAKKEEMWKEWMKK